MPNVYYICFVPQQLQCLATRVGKHYSAVECVELNFSHSIPISNCHLLAAKWPSLVIMIKRRSWRWLRQLRRMVNIWYILFICFYIISFHVVIFHKFKRMCGYHLKAIILAEAKVTIKVFHPCHLCKVPRLMAESHVAKESRLMYVY